MIDEPFDSKKIEGAGWRQGSVLDGVIREKICSLAPRHIEINSTDWLILSSHDCDIANFSLDKEPVVEVIRAVVSRSKKPDAQKTWGRNPRLIQIEAQYQEQAVYLDCNVHDRWIFPREILLLGAPSQKKLMTPRIRRLMAEWLAKRYIRAAFPSQFDARWKGDRSINLKKWTDLLETFNPWIQGIYLRLSTMEELNDPAMPYRCSIITAVPKEFRTEKDWPLKHEEIERMITDFWTQFEPLIICDEVDVLGSDEITLNQFELYQRFDADWLSFSDDEYPMIPIAADLKTL